MQKGLHQQISIQKSYHSTAFELINPLLLIIPSFEYDIFLKDLKSTLPSSVAL